jgi:hypothetical protein
VSHASPLRLLRRALPGILLLCATALSAQVSASSMPLDSGFGPLDPTPPTIPVAQIVKEFTAKESLFKAALNDYTWTRTVKVQTLDSEGKPNGEYYQVVDIYYDRSGQRKERVTEAPESTLKEVMMSESDFSDIEQRLPFVLTTEDAGQYNISYQGRQRIDKIDTWVFAVKPKKIEKHHRYFQGRVWVDQKEHQIVVADGKNVPDDLRRGHEDLSLPFITYRQMIDGQYWFPVYTMGEGTLHFTGGTGYMSQNVHMREIVTYSNYHRFRSSIRVFYGGKDITNNGKAASKQAPPSKGPTTAPQNSPQH